MSLLTLIEELSLNAYPGVQMLHYDGWVLCLSPGRWRRANSVQIMQPSLLLLDEKIDTCEAVYGAQGKPTVFKLTRQSQAEIEPALIARGYRHDAETSVQMKAFTPAAPLAAFPDVTVTLDPDAAYKAAFFAIHHLSETERGPWERIQQGIVPLCGYLGLQVAGETVAVAIGVVERGWLGVYGVGVRPEMRRRGHAQRIMAALLAWGAAHGATHTYLQVMLDNPAALALYGRLGYREAYRYWYRQK
jgi:ribosomal protein S18 acetylase RimI-like enzyme